MPIAPSRILLVLALPTPALAQGIDYVSQLRTLSVEASAENLDNTFVVESDALSVPDFQPLDESLAVAATSDACFSRAFIECDSTLGPTTIEGSAQVLVMSDLSQQGLITAYGIGEALTDIRFEVHEPSVYRFSAAIEILEGGSGQVRCFGIGPIWTFPGSSTIDICGLIAPGQYRLEADVRPTAVSNENTPVPDMASGTYRFRVDVGPQATPYCTALPNMTGAPALMDWTGSTSIANNDLVLHAEGLPAGSLALVVYGAERAREPFGNGLLCIGGGIARLGSSVQASAAGTLDVGLDYSLPSTAGGPFAIVPGSIWNFQVWYRDLIPGSAGFNLSDALEVRFCP